METTHLSHYCFHTQLVRGELKVTAHQETSIRSPAIVLVCVFVAKDPTFGTRRATVVKEKVIMNNPLTLPEGESKFQVLP